MEWTLGFMQRMLFGTAQAYVKQLYASGDYKSLCPVYGIGIVNDIFEKSSCEWYHPAYSEGELEAYNKYWDEVRNAKTLLSGKLEEGRIEGRMEGRKEEKIAIAKQLLDRRFPTQGIADVTQLTPSEIEQLQLQTLIEFSHS